MRLKNKKLTKSLSAVALVLILLAVLFIMENRRVGNVFDEMYQSVKHPLLSTASFGFVWDIGRLTNIIPGSSETTPTYLGGYRQNKLEHGEHIY